MAVRIEKPIERIEKSCAGERLAISGTRGRRPQIVRGSRLLARDLRERDELDRLLGADRPFTGGKLRIHQALVREPDLLARLPDSRLVKGQRAHDEDDLDV